MGLQDRDYMRDVPIYRRLVGLDTAPAAGGAGGGRRRPPTAWADPPAEPSWWSSLSGGRLRRKWRRRPLAWFLLGVAVTLAAVGYASARGLPLVGDDTVEMAPLAVPVRAPGTAPPLRLPIAGREALARGTTVALEGTVPPDARRVVVVRVRWNGGPWEGLTAAQVAADGTFRVTYTLDRHGTAQVRVLLGDGSFAYKWYRVG